MKLRVKKAYDVAGKRERSLRLNPQKAPSPALQANALSVCPNPQTWMISVQWPLYRTSAKEDIVHRRQWMSRRPRARPLQQHYLGITYEERADSLKKVRSLQNMMQTSCSLSTISKAVPSRLAITCNGMASTIPMALQVALGLPLHQHHIKTAFPRNSDGQLKTECWAHVT